MGDFLHGVRTLERETGPRPIQQQPVAVAGLIGTAPIGPVNKLTIVSNDIQAAQFGSKDLPGFTIPQALDAIFDHGAGRVLVINVLDPENEDHIESVTNENVVFHAVTGRATLGNTAIFDLVLTDGAEATYVLDEDYAIIDPGEGIIQALPGGDIAFGSTKKATYNHLDPTNVLAADIIGGVDIAGQRSGIQAMQDAMALFRYKPKILLAPGFSTQNSVRAELDIMAKKLRGFSVVSAPIGTTPQQAIEGRGPAGSINFNTSSENQLLTYPYLKAHDAATNTDRLEPYCQRFVGVWLRSIVLRGFHFSPSNQEILGITGSERPISFDPSDTNCEANQLNAAGIITVANRDGMKTWGNRSAAWPSVTHPRNFISVRLTSYVIYDAIEMASLQFSDLPIDDAFIDSVVESCNRYLRGLKKTGAIIGGRVWYDPTKNDPTQIAAGRIKFCYDFMPPTPAELIEYEAVIDINYLATLGQAA